MTPTGLSASASTQQITIETSANDQDNRFFGGVLQVVVSDPDADDDNTIEEIQVNISADPDTGTAGSDLILVPETTNSSGRFEFFLVHVDSTAVGPDDLDSTNRAGIEGDGTCITDCAPLITFGSGGDLDIQSDLYEDVTFEIEVGNLEAEASYGESDAALDLDRDSYGTTSFVYISVFDQDANLNPTERDQFTVNPDSDPNDDLLVLDGGSFDDVMIFRETGDNTAIFEGRYRLGDSILVDSESLVLTLFDKANYNATLAAPENDSNNTDEISFMVGNNDGIVEVGGSQQTEPVGDATLAADKDSYSTGETVHVTITDHDANGNSGATDSIHLAVSSGSISIEVLATETGANTGVFEASFLLAAETDPGSGAIAPGGSATITYTDERPADYFERVQAGQNPEKEFTLEVDVQLPVKTGIDATDVTAPIIQDQAGESGPYVVGDSLTLSTSITNNNEKSQPFVVIIEVRDSNDVTVFLALQSGTLDPSGSTNIGVLWQPYQAGTFEVRTFAITSISGEVELLSSPAVSEIIVG